MIHLLLCHLAILTPYPQWCLCGRTLGISELLASCRPPREAPHCMHH
jgi:hypothetical protein